MIFFSDRIEQFIPPKKGKKHILRIIREIIDFHPESEGTDIAVALEFLTNALKKRTTSFLLTDYSKPMEVANRKHDLVAVQVYDKRDASIPDVGMVSLRDSETGAVRLVDTSSRKIRTLYDKAWYASQQKLTAVTGRSGVDLASISTDEDFVKSLLGLFRKRSTR